MRGLEFVRNLLRSIALKQSTVRKLHFQSWKWIQAPTWMSIHITTHMSTYIYNTYLLHVYKHNHGARGMCTACVPQLP